MPVLNRLQQGTFTSSGEILDWSYYDTASIVANASPIRLFQQGLSSGKTQDQTNMTGNGQIPTGQKLDIHAIRFQYVSANAVWASAGTAQVQRFYTMLKTSVLNFKIPGKDSILTITLAELLGATTLLAMVPSDSGQNIPLISPIFKGEFKLSKRITIAEQVPFEVNISPAVAFDSNLVGDLLMISLNGILARRS